MSTFDDGELLVIVTVLDADSHLVSVKSARVKKGKTLSVKPEISNKQIVVTISNGRLAIDGVVARFGVGIFRVRRVHCENIRSVSLQKGVYIISIDNEIVKIAL